MESSLKPISWLLRHSYRFFVCSLNVLLVDSLNRPSWTMVTFTENSFGRIVFFMKKITIDIISKTLVCVSQWEFGAGNEGAFEITRSSKLFLSHMCCSSGTRFSLPVFICWKKGEDVFKTKKKKWRRRLGQWSSNRWKTLLAIRCTQTSFEIYI